MGCGAEPKPDTWHFYWQDLISLTNFSVSKLQTLKKTHFAPAAAPATCAIVAVAAATATTTVAAAAISVAAAVAAAVITSAATCPQS